MPATAAPAAPPVKSENHRGWNAKQAINARWAAESATADELKELFTDIPLEDGLTLLVRMRNNCEVAARILEARRTSTENQHCKTCNKTLEEAGIRMWRLNRPRRDNKTGTIYVEYFCSDVCIALENKLEHGVAVVSDQGVDATKRNIIAHQEKVMQQAKEAKRKADKAKHTKER